LGRIDIPFEEIMNFPPKVAILEVGPRDGFQNEKQFIPTARKIGIINALSRTGQKNIQAISFDGACELLKSLSFSEREIEELKKEKILVF